jgi:hypothetical protein
LLLSVLFCPFCRNGTQSKPNDESNDQSPSMPASIDRAAGNICIAVPGLYDCVCKATVAFIVQSGFAPPRCFARVRLCQVQQQQRFFNE